MGESDKPLMDGSRSYTTPEEQSTQPPLSAHNDVTAEPEQHGPAREHGVAIDGDPADLPQSTVRRRRRINQHIAQGTEPRPERQPAAEVASSSGYIWLWGRIFVALAVILSIVALSYHKLVAGMVRVDENAKVIQIEVEAAGGAAVGAAVCVEAVCVGVSAVMTAAKSIFTTRVGVNMVRPFVLSPRPARSLMWPT